MKALTALKNIPYQLRLVLIAGVCIVGIIVMQAIHNHSEAQLVDGACIDVPVMEHDDPNSVAVRTAELLRIGDHIVNYDDVTRDAGSFNHDNKFTDRVCVNPERNKISYINGVRLRK